MKKNENTMNSESGKNNKNVGNDIDSNCDSDDGDDDFCPKEASVNMNARTHTHVCVFRYISTHAHI